MPAQIKAIELSVGGGNQGRENVRLQASHQHLALRVAEADVVFQNFGALFANHESGK